MHITSSSVLIMEMNCCHITSKSPSKMERRFVYKSCQSSLLKIRSFVYFLNLWSIILFCASNWMDIFRHSLSLDMFLTWVPKLVVASLWHSVLSCRCYELWSHGRRSLFSDSSSYQSQRTSVFGALRIYFDIGYLAKMLEYRWYRTKHSLDRTVLLRLIFTSWSIQSSDDRRSSYFSSLDIWEFIEILIIHFLYGASSFDLDLLSSANIEVQCLQEKIIRAPTRRIRDLQHDVQNEVLLNRVCRRYSFYMSRHFWQYHQKLRALLTLLNQASSFHRNT